MRQAAFETELRGGIPHYRPRQYEAWRTEDDPDVALLAYVDMLGWIVELACERIDGEWRAAMVVARVAATGLGSRSVAGVPSGFVLSDAMREALDRAEVVV